MTPLRANLKARGRSSTSERAPLSWSIVRYDDFLGTRVVAAVEFDERLALREARRRNESAVFRPIPAIRHVVEANP